jgi:hypothetical protein
VLDEPVDERVEPRSAEHPDLRRRHQSLPDEEPFGDPEDEESDDPDFDSGFGSDFDSDEVEDSPFDSLLEPDFLEGVR